MAKTTPKPLGKADPQKPNEHPYCETCKKPVEWFSWEYPTVVNPDESGTLWADHTGEKILTVRCHGRVHKVSNWRGVLLDGEDEISHFKVHPPIIPPR